MLFPVPLAYRPTHDSLDGVLQLFFVPLGYADERPAGDYASGRGRTSGLQESADKIQIVAVGVTGAGLYPHCRSRSTNGSAPRDAQVPLDRAYRVSQRPFVEQRLPSVGVAARQNSRISWGLPDTPTGRTLGKRVRTKRLKAILYLPYNEAFYPSLGEYQLNARDSAIQYLLYTGDAPEHRLLDSDRTHGV